MNFNFLAQPYHDYRQATPDMENPTMPHLQQMQPMQQQQPMTVDSSQPLPPLVSNFDYILFRSNVKKTIQTKNASIYSFEKKFISTNKPHR